MTATSREERRQKLRTGWCPGALRPMVARDGLLVRLRITGGIVSSRKARALAELARTHGNGLFDLSARANLQMRGVREQGHPSLLDGLRSLDLIDADARGEAVRNVLASPLAGLRSGLDIRPLTAALEARLTLDADLRGLPAKFGFLLDDGGEPTLADTAADVRFEWVEGRQAFAVGLGGTRAGSAFAGWCEPHAVVQRAVEVARTAIALQSGTDRPCRMRDLLGDLNRRAAHELFGIDPELRLDRACPSGKVVGLQTSDEIGTLGLAAPFGRLDAAMLGWAAQIADDAGSEAMRLTPWRTILVPLARVARRHESLVRRGLTAGFIVDSRDPRLRVAACVGAAGCDRGTTPTHQDAAALADLAPVTGAATVPTLHVSGCAKGCAKPSRSAITLVGREGRYDLVRNGSAGDESLAHALDLEGVRAALGIAALEPA